MNWFKKIVSKLKRPLVLAAVLLQPVSVWFAERGGSQLFEEGGGEPLITPAGYAFSIWSVIVLGTIAYAIRQILPSKVDDTLYDNIALRSAAVFACFAVWIGFASQQWLWGTVVVFVTMGLLLRSIFFAIKTELSSPVDSFITFGSFALYYGWTTVAVFANLASALQYYGWPVTGLLGLTWQALILLTALLVSLFLLRETNYSIPYFLTLLWAFISITAGTISAGKEAIPLFILSTISTVYLLFKGIRSSTFLIPFKSN